MSFRFRNLLPAEDYMSFLSIPVHAIRASAFGQSLRYVRNHIDPDHTLQAILQISTWSDNFSFPCPEVPASDKLTETRSKSVAFPVLHVVFHPGVLPGMAASGCGHIRSVLSYTLPLFLKISLYVFTNPVDCVREAGFFPTSDSLIFFFHICPHRLLTDSPL